MEKFEKIFGLDEDLPGQVKHCIFKLRKLGFNSIYGWESQTEPGVFFIEGIEDVLIWYHTGDSQFSAICEPQRSRHFSRINSTKVTDFMILLEKVL